MIVTTTQSVEDYGITDILGGRAGACEEDLGQASGIAPAELEDRARALVASAVAGVDRDYEVISSIMMVSAYGSAVVIG